MTAGLQAPAAARWSRARLAACMAVLGWACASAPAPSPDAIEITPQTLYPFTLANAWSYDVQTGEDERVLAVTRVVSADGHSATVKSGETLLRYELRPDGIFRPARGGYLLRAPIELDATWDAGGGGRARISAVGQTIETPAGRFEGCATVQESAPSGTQIETVYCPGVGPVRVVSTLALSATTARVVAVLRGYRVASRQP